MPKLGAIEVFEFGGVDSRSNPLNMPQGRALRCLNFAPKQNGELDLRWGYSTVSMDTVTSANNIHTIIPYNLYSGTKYLVFGQGAGQIYALNLQTGVRSQPTVRGASISGSPFQGYFFNNRLHFGDGIRAGKFYDGNAIRDNGLRALNSLDAAGSSVSIGANDTLGIPASTIGGNTPGYQFFMSIFNPLTGHVGNRIAIGARVAPSTASDINITGLPDLSGEDTEWVKAIGRTNDGALTPYWIVDASGNRISAGNTNTTITITQSGIDGNSELPTRNGVIPSVCSMFATVGDYVFAADTGSPTIRKSGSVVDQRNGIFVGQPEQSWAPDDIETFPTAANVTGIFEYDYELIVGTQHDIAVLTDYAGALQWRGPWNVGVAGPRAGCKTPYGFYWLNWERQLCTFVNGLPVAISEEYEATELSLLGFADLSSVEVAYFRDAQKQIDVLAIKGFLADRTTSHIVYHDFRLRDGRSPYGQGYGATYVGALATQFTIAAGRDGTGKLRLFAGCSSGNTATQGRIYQLFDTANDAGNEFSANYVMLINGGPERPSIPFIDFYGDRNVQISVGRELDNTTSIENLTPLDNPAQQVQGQEHNLLYRAKLAKPEIRNAYVQIDLVSHSTDGSLALNTIPHYPLESYGRIWAMIPATGETRNR
jgi:hypothetical protein